MSATETTAVPDVGLQSMSLPAGLRERVEEARARWQAEDRMARLWARDAGLWTGGDEGRWLDWLGAVDDALADMGEFKRVYHWVEGRYFTHGVLLGMGGSSLAPEVLRLTFGPQPEHPDWIILDSTDPAQIRTVASRLDYARTVFLVASKSGTTLEPNILMDYFFQQAGRVLGDKRAAEHFGAVTDPGSRLERVAAERGFRAVFHGRPGIGGRYSALSPFGLVPAAAMGLDVERLLRRARAMVTACGPDAPAETNPGLALGLVLGEAARAGRDKLTVFCSPGLRSLGAWLEQLIAESTGKQGRAIIPVDGEHPADPDEYGQDRLFVHVRLAGDDDADQAHAVRALEAAGHPVVRIEVADRHDIGQEFFRWEMATAVAGSVMGINPFDQPDVEAAKVEARKLTEAYEATGTLPAEEPVATGDGLVLYTDAANAAVLAAATGGSRDPGALLRAHLERAGRGDYFALLAYLNRLDPVHEEHLQAIRHAVRDARGVATCLGWGPRFLHSTGQAYKGGPDTGVFLEITADPADDIEVPGKKYTFGVVEAAQAQGDFRVLLARGRRALRVHLGPDTHAGLGRLRGIIEEQLAS